jgi:predicted Zn-dependent peptidase
MMWLGEHILGHGRVLPPEQVRAKLAAVTAAEMRAVAAEFLRPGNLSLALVSTRDSDAGLNRILHRAFE